MGLRRVAGKSCDPMFQSSPVAVLCDLDGGPSGNIIRVDLTLNVVLTASGGSSVVTFRGRFVVG